MFEQVKKNLWALGKKNNNLMSTTKNYYQDLINPYQLLFHPSYLEVNDEKLVDFMVLNDMSWEKSINYLNPLFRYPKKNKISLFFSPVDSTNLVEEYQKTLTKMKIKYERDLDEWKDPDKKMGKFIEDYTEQITALEEWEDSFLNYSILYSQEKSKDLDESQDNDTLNSKLNEEYLKFFQEDRIALKRFFKKSLEQPTKFYSPLWQIEEAYKSQQPLWEYHLKDWSNISAVNWITLYPFFTETKEPSVSDWVPYWINRNTWELFFFNHSKLYDDKEITNRNMNVFWGTWAWKTSFFRSQVPLRMSYWDHFILFDPKKDYVAFTKDMWWQNISFKVDQPVWFNLFYRSNEKYESEVVINWEKKLIEKEIQTIEEKKQNLLKIFWIMCPYLSKEGDESAEFSKSILDSALSRVYEKDITWDSVTLQKFYDEFLTESIKFFTENEPTKVSTYTQAGERLRTNLWNFVIREDESKWRYYKMFLPVPKDQELKLEDGPLINFDLSSIFHDDQLFTIWALIWFEFTRTQIAARNRRNRTIYVVIDENWKLLKYKQAWIYEESFSRLIRWLWGGIYTFSQNLSEYINSEEGQQVLDQAQVNIVLKLEWNQLERLKKHFPLWFTEEINKDFERINQSKNSHWQGYIYMKWRNYPFKYLYLPSIWWRDSWQEREVWQHNLDSDMWVEQK